MGKGSPQADPQHQHEQWGEAGVQHFGKERLTVGERVRWGEAAVAQDAREDELENSKQDSLNFRCRGARQVLQVACSDVEMLGWWLSQRSALPCSL